jgi:superfamily I DNA and/or RNA helicase
LIDLIFLKALREKLKGGNLKSIHLNVLPGRFVARLDLGNMNYVKPGLAEDFLQKLLNEPCFEFEISFDEIDLNEISNEEKKRINLVSKRLNAMVFENEDNFKEHGIKTFGFGYPILLKHSRQDPTKIIKAPLFIWPLEILNVRKKVNTWLILRNKIRNNESGRIVNEEIHSVNLNEVLLSHIKNDENKIIPQINEELLEDEIIDSDELINECYNVLKALNPNTKEQVRNDLLSKLNDKIENIPDSKSIESISNINPWMIFGGVFGLFRTQKESIITDIDRLIEKYDEFKFENFITDKFPDTPYSSVETDPSQQEILNTLSIEQKKIIQGPPGTGKSQSLSAIITNSLASNLKCLVVCEKKTALDVIKNNLSSESSNIGELAAVIEDINKDRDAIVNSVRNRISSLKDTISFNKLSYDSTLKNIEDTVSIINDQHKQLDKKVYRGKIWTELVGELLKREKESEFNLLKEKLDYNLFKFQENENEFSDIVSKLEPAKELYSDVNQLDHPLNILKLELFKQGNPRGIQMEIENISNKALPEIKKLNSEIKESIDNFDNLFTEENNFTLIRLKLLSIFSKRYKNLISFKNRLKEDFYNKEYLIGSRNIFGRTVESTYSIKDIIKQLKILEDDVSDIRNNVNKFVPFYNWKNFLIELDPIQKKAIEGLLESGCNNWTRSFEYWYYYWLLSLNENKDLPKNDNRIIELFKVKDQLKKIQNKSIIYNWSTKQIESIKKAKLKNLSPVSLFNKRGRQGERRNSLRKIIQTDFELFTDFFPVVMVSPTVCSSILPLTEGIFDLVIFDEASQLRLEDTFPALVRGKTKIVSGDSQQMPPSSYFQGGNALMNPSEDDYEDEDGDEEIRSRQINNSLDLANSESLLVYAENCNYSQSHLKVHYRSRHPYLIDFSNHAFYGRRLIPMPSKNDYKPIDFIEVNGLYEDQVNLDEARKVVDILLNEIKPVENGKFPSVGIATFNIYQRNLILEEISKARQTNSVFDQKISKLESDLFVKNLENIQGDERDIIIISTTFGKKMDGSFRQNFGPISQGNGFKLLNVIITRAKYKIFICTSIPQNYILQYPNLLEKFKNNGRGVFYSYLAYAKAVSEGNEEIRNSVLKHLYENCESKSFDVEINDLGSESPFEEEVYSRLSEKIGQHRLEQQYKIGGFRIDIVVKSKQGKPIIAIECDGAKYHSSNEAYAWDMFRQNQIEQYGIKFFRIWSTNWWNSPQLELNKLLEFINSNKIEKDDFL